MDTITITVTQFNLMFVLSVTSLVCGLSLLFLAVVRTLISVVRSFDESEEVEFIEED